MTYGEALATLTRLATCTACNGKSNHLFGKVAAKLFFIPYIT